MTKTTNTGSQSKQRQAGVLENLRPLIVDVAVPLGSYYFFKEAFGMSTFAALAWSSVVPAVRTVWSVVRERRVNGLAALILVVNVVGLALSFVSGDPRLMLAKDGAVSSTVGIGILVSVALGKPMMTAGLKPFLVKGDAAREAAWERLASGTAVRSAEFLKKERVFSVIWGLVLVVECVARVVGAYTIPVATMVWLSSLLLVVAITLGMVVCGGAAAEPMACLITDEVKRQEAAAQEREKEQAEGQEPRLAVAA
ncbi:VC0807 family protein [Streptomyces sp. NPDC007901]|uniref:VC0807 family protein n=1 Tax=Streptomyces sp. NPDC007901 TaxID=3364785 RepID=UPI0036E0A594